MSLLRDAVTTNAARFSFPASAGLRSFQPSISDPVLPN